jgi:hypothetical protein
MSVPDFSEMSPLAAAQAIASVVHDVRSNNLAEYTKPTRVVSMCLIDTRLLQLDPKILKALLQTELSLYCGFYLTAINLSMTVGNVSVMRLLDKFSSDSSLLSAAGNSNWWSQMESFDEGLEYIDSTAVNLPVTMESFNTSIGPEVEDVEQFRGSSKPYDNDKTLGRITDESNLAVGKVLDVRLVSGDCSVTMPVHIYLSPKSMDSNSIIASAQFEGVDKSMKARWRQWRSGEIKFFKDYLLAGDIIEANRKALLGDKTGVLSSIQSQRSKGILASLIRGYAAPNAVSAVLNVSKETARGIETAIRGQLSNFTARQRYFSGNSLMTLVVVDPTMERFTVYQRGIDDFSHYTFDDIKANGTKANGTDIDAVLKAYNLGHAAPL